MKIYGNSFMYTFPEKGVTKAADLLDSKQLGLLIYSILKGDTCDQTILYNHTQTEKLCAAHWREEQKNTKYQEALHTQNIMFIPMALETFGGKQPVFATLADRISCHSNHNNLTLSTA